MKHIFFCVKKTAHSKPNFSGDYYLKKNWYSFDCNVSFSLFEIWACAEWKLENTHSIFFYDSSRRPKTIVFSNEIFMCADFLRCMSILCICMRISTSGRIIKNEVMQQLFVFLYTLKLNSKKILFWRIYADKSLFFFCIDTIVNKKKPKHINSTSHFCLCVCGSSWTIWWVHLKYRIRSSFFLCGWPSLLGKIPYRVY